MTEETFYQTAYREALSKQLNDENQKLPDYMIASDTLNTANRNQSFLESAADVVAATPKFIGLSVISGVNQIYNIPTDIGNLFGANYERSNTDDVVAAMDSDLSSFYQEHQEGIDMLGFVASSILPGVGGIKVLNAGQRSLEAAIGAGKFGTGMGKSMGLLVPSKKKHLTRALEEIRTTSAAPNLIQGEALKAVGAGFGQNILEAAAFETAVAATLFNSPMLENQTFGDFLANIAFGAGVFGIVGGAVDAAVINSALKAGSKEAAIEARPWTHIRETPTAAKEYEKIALNFEQLEEMSLTPIPKTFSNDRIAFLQTEAKKKAGIIQNKIRTDIGKLAGGDQILGSTIHNAFKLSPYIAKQEAFIGLREITRATEKSGLENRLAKLTAKLKGGKADAVEEEEFLNISTAWSKVWGENVGKTATEIPVNTALIDTLKNGQTIKVSPKGVEAGKAKYKFDLTNNVGSKAGKEKQWDIFAATPVDANARYIWASKLDKFSPTKAKPLLIHETDLPLLEKALMELSDDEMQFLKIRTENGDISILGQNRLDYLGDRKETMAIELHTATISGATKSSEEIVLDKLRNQLNTKGLNPQQRTMTSLTAGVDKALLAGYTAKAKAMTQEEIAAVLNIKNSFLSGQQVKSDAARYASKDIMAMQDHQEVYRAGLIEGGLSEKAAKEIDVWNIPQNVKLSYDSTPFVGLDNFVTENMVIIKDQQISYTKGVDRAVAMGVDPVDFDKLIPIDSGFVKSGATPEGAAASRFGASNGNYGSLAATVQFIGKTTASMITKAKAATSDVLDPLVHKLVQNEEAYLEWSVLNANVRSTADTYGINAAGDALEPISMIQWKEAVAKATKEGTTPPKRPELNDPQSPLRWEMKTDEVRKLAQAHVERNGDRTQKLHNIRAAQGASYNRDVGSFYPIPIDPKDFPHFAIVTDETITSGGQNYMLYAKSGDDLKGQVDKLSSNVHLKIRTKKEAEDYFKAEGQFSYENTLSDNYLDITAKRAGVSAPYTVSTDPQKIASEILNWHGQRETGTVRELIKAKYEVPFEELRRLGEGATNVETSTFSSASLLKFTDKVVANPYEGTIETALAVAKGTKYPFWDGANTMADNAFSAFFNRIGRAVQAAKTPDELAATHKIMQEAGYKGAAYDAGMDIFANATPDKNLLTRVIQMGNSVLATVVLRWDPLNAVNNAVSANVLLGAETKAVARAIAKGDAEAVGALAKLTKIKVPGTDESVVAPSKMIATAMSNFHRKGPEMDFYRENGFITTIHGQYVETLDKLAYTGGDVAGWQKSIMDTQKNLKGLADKGEGWTGNTLAEEFNRFVAADVMKQMTDVAVERGLMSSKEALAYINTFVNRTQGNYLASQRPMMFKGPIGQAIGLFQTYQFNLMQQLLRHVGEGHAKDSMTLLGLQGTIHGMNGLPGFNAINTNLIGNASGNVEHRDAYDATYGIAGKEAGDWLMYGMASNALGLIDPQLKLNLYTRGDINPRHVTILPTDPSQVAIIQASGKFFGNLFETAKKLKAGGDVSKTILQGIEHNSISRPLAGLAQTLEGFTNPAQASYSTSKRGNVIGANDLLSLTNFARIVGGKPLDEAIALDASYRFKAYNLKDTKKRGLLGEAIKTTMIAGGDPTQEQIEDFAEQYARTGGRQKEFAGWMTQLYKTANLSQTNKIQQSLNSPFSQSMQKIMGGEELRDFSE